MKCKHFPALFCTILFLAVLVPCTIARAGTEKQELTTIDSLSIYKQGVVILCGDTAEWEDTLEGWRWQFLSLVALGETPDISASLELESIDTSGVALYSPGIYNVQVTMKLEDTFTDTYFIRDENRVINIPVYISGAAGLKLCLILDASFAYKFAWYGPDDSLPLEIQYLETTLDTFYTEADLATAAWTVCDNPDIAVIAWPSMTIFKPVPQDKAYYFRVRVGGDYTDAVRITYTDPPVKPDEGISGNRDGADHEEPELPPLFQTAPGSSKDRHPQDQACSHPVSSRPASSRQNPSTVTGPADTAGKTDTAGNTPVTEIVTETKTTLSGARIRALLAPQESFVTFSWDGICLRIPGDFFDTLALEDDDLFSVEMKRLSSHSFTLNITAKDIPLKEFAPSSVQLATSSPETPFTLYLNDKRLDTAVTYEAECAVFDITRTGIYRLRTEMPAGAAMTEDTSSGPRGPYIAVVVIVTIFFLTGMLLFYRLRHRGGSRI